MNPLDQPTPLHQQLDQLRESAGLSYQQLADRAGMDVAHVHRISKGSRQPSRDALLCLCIGLACDVDTTNILLSSAKHLPLMNRGAS